MKPGDLVRISPHYSHDSGALYIVLGPAYLREDRFRRYTEYQLKTLRLLRLGETQRFTNVHPNHLEVVSEAR